MAAGSDPAGAIVQLIDELAWEGEAAVDPLGEGWPVEAWLAFLREHGLALRALPISRIAGGPYDGGHVLVAQNGDRLYFAVPAAAIPALIGHLPDDDFAELVRRTPALGGAPPAS